ncbi:MAG: hypothetical protein K6G57_02120 [Lachnospiraceae bacterium]|nr:hypothetical protein [Lachnospiraceae bacterium]
MWLKGKNNRLCNMGCGVVALVDFCIYEGLIPKPKDRDEYCDRINEYASKYIPIIPGLGIAPYIYPFFVNRFFRKNGYPYRIKGITFIGKTDRLIRMLEDDIPVIFAAGATYPIVFRKKGVMLYSPSDEGPSLITASGQRARSHYMTLTGIEKLRTKDEKIGSDYLRVYSWGREYYISPREYSEFSRYTFPATNMFYVIKRL